MAPFHRTRLLKKASTEVSIEKGPFYLVLHAYDGQRLAGREVTEVNFHMTQTKASFQTLSVMLEISKVKPYEVNNNFRAGISEATNRLALYVESDLKRLEQMKPRERALQQTHSVYYEFPLKPTLFVPYVALAGRLGPLLACTETELNDWQSFFIHEMPVAMRECAISPATFVATCRQESLTNGNLFYVYNSIAVAFSRFIAGRVSYAKDIDYYNERLRRFQPDKRQLGRRLRRRQPACLRHDANLSKHFSRPQNYLAGTSRCYYVAHFLNKAEIWMLQGAVGDQRASHVWCAIMPPSGPAHYVESTGLPQNSFYKCIVRAWQIDHAGRFSDSLLVDPERPNMYGMPSSLIVNYESDGLNVFRRWVLRNPTAINEELRFANLLDAPLMHPMNLLMRKF